MKFFPMNALHGRASVSASIWLKKNFTATRPSVSMPARGSLIEGQFRRRMRMFSRSSGSPFKRRSLRLVFPDLKNNWSSESGVTSCLGMVVIFSPCVCASCASIFFIFLHVARLFIISFNKKNTLKFRQYIALLKGGDGVLIRGEC